MIRNGVNISYYTQSVDSEDQAISLVQYLTRHGQPAFKSQSDEVQVAMECATEQEAAETSSLLFRLVECWRLFWTHSDSGVFELPIYVKD